MTQNVYNTWILLENTMEHGFGESKPDYRLMYFISMMGHSTEMAVQNMNEAVVRRIPPTHELLEEQPSFPAYHSGSEQWNTVLLFPSHKQCKLFA